MSTFCAWGSGGSFPDTEFVATDRGVLVHRVDPLHTTTGRRVTEIDGQYYNTPERIDVAEGPALAFSEEDRAKLDEPRSEGHS